MVALRGTYCGAGPLPDRKLPPRETNSLPWIYRLMSNRLCNILSSLLSLLLIAGSGNATQAATACEQQSGVGLSRIAEIDTSTGPLYGDISKFQRQADFLKPKEVVLTFDDGPMPWITKSILDTLDKNCTKATFFSVGRMAIAYPDTLKAILARGHTLGTHTWSHPMSLKRLNADAAVGEIERGFAAVSAAAGQPIAPFFRFPGLNDSSALLSHLQSRQTATFTVDVVSNDSYINSVEKLTRETIAKVESRNGGIILFHDIKAVTAKALPGILTELKTRGFRVVHMVPSQPFVPDQKLAADFSQQLLKAEAKSGGDKKKMLPFFGAVGPDKIAQETGAPITIVKPVAIAFADRGKAQVQTVALRRAGRPQLSPTEVSSAAWVTTVRRQYKGRDRAERSDTPTY
jgi:peptidoglycan/xylan/chitin deacetylase (PgdA/CDA1 family)